LLAVGEVDVGDALAHVNKIHVAEVALADGFDAPEEEAKCIDKE
jgi:hypothetical protein